MRHRSSTPSPKHETPRGKWQLKRPSMKISRTQAVMLTSAACVGGVLPLTVPHDSPLDSPLVAVVAKATGVSDKSASVDRAVTPPPEVSQSSALGALEVKVDDTKVDTAVVEYFRQACTPLAVGAGVVDRVSIITEQAIGQTLDEKKTTHAEGVATLAQDLRAASETLSALPSPANTPLAAASYESNLKQIREKFVQVADGLDPFVQQLRDADSLQKLTEGEAAYKKQLGENAPVLVELLNNLVGSPGGVTAATSEAIRQLEGCQGLLKPTPLPADTFVVEPAVDLHVRLSQALTMVDEGDEKIRTLYADTEGKSFSEGKTATLAAWDMRIDAIQRAIDHIQQWQHPDDLPLDLENALAGYDQLRDDAVHVLEGIRDTTRQHRDALAAATSPSALNTALTPASEALNQDAVAQKKLTVRADRIAPSPNTATTKEISSRLPAQQQP